MKIKELINSKEVKTYTVTGLVIKMSKETSKANLPYALLTIKDATGTVDLRRWNIDILDDCKVGDVCDFVLDSKEYNGHLSFVVHSYAINEGEKAENYDNNFIPEIKDLIDRLNDTLDFIKENNQECFVVIDELNKKYRDDFIKYPAAKTMHHDGVHGLLFHTVSMIEHAKGLISSAKEMYHVDIDETLVYTAIILHDFFKIREYTLNEIGKADVNKYVLIGHITLAAQHVGALHSEGKIGDYVYFNLTHAVLAHHGELEYGSPVVPSTIEAYIVHIADIFDSRMYVFKDEMSKLEPDEMSANKNYVIKANVYRPDCCSESL